MYPTALSPLEVRIGNAPSPPPGLHATVEDSKRLAGRTLARSLPGYGARFSRLAARRRNLQEF